jgi:hypothetical protein
MHPLVPERKKSVLATTYVLQIVSNIGGRRTGFGGIFWLMQKNLQPPIPKTETTSRSLNAAGWSRI